MAQEVVKMKQGMSYTKKEKTIILNVFKYFQKMCPDKCVTENVKQTSRATGCSEKSIFHFRKEEASKEGFRNPSKTRERKSTNINNRLVKYNNNTRQTIRNIIYNLKHKNINPSLSTLLKNIRADNQLPALSLTTLRRLLCDMGFYYEKDKDTNKIVLVEKAETSKGPILPEPSPNLRHGDVTQPVLITSSQNASNVQETFIYMSNVRQGYNYPPFQQGNQMNHMQIPPNHCISYQMPLTAMQLQHAPHNYLDTSNKIL
nr:unnamed protein product [Callosobruchus chinensis]